MSLLDTSRLPGSFWRFSVHGIKNAQFSIYLHFICCTVMQRIKEAVAVKLTLKSLRDEISFLKAGFDAPLHSRVACIGSKEDFFPPLCMGVCACVCVCERVGAREKKLRGAQWLGVQVSFVPVSCATAFVELHTCVTSVILEYYLFFLRLCAQSWKSVMLSCSMEEIRNN